MINTYLFISFLLCIVFVIIKFYKPTSTTSVANSHFNIDFQSVPCETSETYCQNDADCGKCSGTATCKSGRCVPKSENVVCDVKKGFSRYLVGNSEFGEWKAECLSVDPGIARKSKVNQMCRGETTDFDYTKKLPVMVDCKCNPVYVPATSNIREYVVCNDDYFDLIRLVYGY